MFRQFERGPEMITTTVGHNTKCTSPLHSEHLCYLLSQGFNISDKKEFECLVDDPKFRCEHCGRTANNNNNLCEPNEL